VDDLEKGVDHWRGRVTGNRDDGGTKNARRTGKTTGGIPKLGGGETNQLDGGKKKTKKTLSRKKFGGCSKNFLVCLQKTWGGGMHGVVRNTEELLNTNGRVVRAGKYVGCNGGDTISKNQGEERKSFNLAEMKNTWGK